MAELLVQAKSHWMDNMSQQDIKNLNEDRKKSRDSRIRLGDIVVVKPNGWEWGREERLPNYLVIKVPQLTVEQVEHFTESLFGESDENGNIPMLKKRKWQIPNNYINSHISAGTSTVTIELTQNQQDLINNMIEKTT